MAASVQTYEVWLTDRLLQLNPDTDTDVFVTYMTGILEEDVPKDEKRESLLDLIGQVVENNMEDICEELLKKWDEISRTADQENDESEKLTEHLANILEQQKIEVVHQKEKTAEEIARKQAILNQYEHVSSGDEDDADDGGTDDPGGDGANLLDFKNTNSELVKKIEQEKREKAKQDSEKKKEKDKLEREAQKQKQKDRKEKETKRTQKGEKRR